MSRGRRQVIQIDEPARVLYSNEPTNDMEDDDNDSAGEMPTPERLVTEDMLPNRPAPSTSSRGGFEIDNKVANFLAEIDALDPGAEMETSESPAVNRNHETSPARDQYTPPRERSPVRSKTNAYSNMFVKGTPEFVKKPDDLQNTRGERKLEPWPEEPKSDWQQLTDEKSNYPYYWNVVTNEVVWDMPAEFSQYLLRQKEYEEKVERGLREGTLDPEQRGKPVHEKQENKSETKPDPEKAEERPSRSRAVHRRRRSHSEDSSSDSSDSDGNQPRSSKRRSSRKTEVEKSQQEVSSSSADSSRATSHDKLKRSATPELPDSTRPDDKKISTSKSSNKDESVDFDIDDIDKELEMALERKRQELMKLEEKKSDDKSDKDKHKDGKKDGHRHRDDDRKEDKHRKHGRHRESDRERDRDRDREKKHHHEREEKKPKLTLKERLRIEMELKMEKERRKKRAIEELMARELEQTVGRGGYKRHRDEKSHKRYRYDDERGDYHSLRDDYGEYSRDFDTWEDRGATSYEDRYIPPMSMKPPPPTDEMIAYEEERRSQVVDYGHGRSSRHHDLNGGSDSEELRSADAREIEMKKLESLELAELALSKLEFLEVTKKGLSKLQILLIELETRHQDWQAGGLTTNHFLGKLREANWQLEQYEASAAPAGWVCSWDRDYRRYFYTHKLTGKTQWDYPDADDIKNEDEKAQEPKKSFTQGREPESEISSTSDKGKGRSMEKDILASMSLPPPPPPPAEEHPSVKSLQLMYGSSSDSENEEPSSKKIKKEPQLSDIQNVPLPPEVPKREKEKKDKHKKKKKKEKSKKKDKEKSEPSTGMVGPVGPVYPQVPAQPLPAQPLPAKPLPVQTLLAAPPPPPGEEPENVTGVETYLNTAAPESYMNTTSQEQPTPMDVPVYGSVESDQAGLNDQPLEFGSVQEATGPHPYAEDMDVVDPGVISHGPQIATVSHEPENYPPVASDMFASGEPVGEGTATETFVESSSSTAYNTEEKKKKKKEKMGTGSISLKKKHVSSMVQKWQKVKKEVELEEQNRQIREAEIRRKLAELE